MAQYSTLHFHRHYIHCAVPREQYKIYNYSRQHKDTMILPDVDAWKAEIGRLTQGKMIVSWSHYTTPLKMLGPLGKIARKVSLTKPYRRLSRNHGLLHKFLVFELKGMAEEDPSSCAVSIEKGRDGLLFQISKKHETVKEQVEGSLRQGVKLHATSESGGFEGALINNLANLERILNAIETTALYDLLSRNCQHTVTDWQRALMDESMRLTFQAPGGRPPISLADPGIVDVVEDLFPEWKNGTVQRFPELPNPFAIEADPLSPLDVPEEIWKDYTLLCKKQKVVEALHQFLLFDSSAFPGRKAIVSNLTKKRFSDSLSITNALPRTITEDLSELWCATFAVLVILEAVGVVIFNLMDECEEADDEHDLEHLLELAAKIQDVSKSKRCFYIVNAKLGEED